MEFLAGGAGSTLRAKAEAGNDPPEALRGEAASGTKVDVIFD